jgi:hypothetical protein
MNAQDKEIKDYYRQIERSLPGSAKAKKHIMDSIQQSVSNYLEEKPLTELAEIRSHFGTPQQIANAYVEQLDTEEVIKKFDIKKTAICVVCGTLLLGLLMWGIGLTITLIHERKSSDGYYEVDPVIDVEMEETQ